MDKVLFIGLDGMDPRVTAVLMKEGKLPNFSRLEFSELPTSCPPNSPVAWTSIATGCNPAKHGVFDFIRKGEGYIPELALFNQRGGKYESAIRAEPFWRVSSKAGLPTTIIRFPVTFPPERVKGNMLSGLGVPDVKGFLSSYSFYTTAHIKDRKVVNVSVNDNLIETSLSGPKVRAAGGIADVKIPMRIAIKKDSVIVSLSGKEYEIKEKSWGPWIKAAFKTGPFSSVHGICKAYLESIKPFGLYVTTVQIDPENPMLKISEPVEYSKQLASEIGPYYTLGIPEETEPVRDGWVGEKALLEQCAQIEEQREAMFWKEFKEFESLKKGLYSCVFDTSDRVQHMFWDNKVGKPGRFIISKEIEEYWIKKDAFIGKVLEKLDKETLLLIASDHGFTSFEKAVSINNWLVEEGYMKLSKPVEGEGALFENVDWSKTEAFSLGFNSLYINAKGREPEGVVADSESKAREIAKKLEKSAGGSVHKAYLREDIYAGACLKDAPDIVIGFNPGYRMSWQNAVGGMAKEAIFENRDKWRGDHLVDPSFVPGVLFSNTKLRKPKSQMDLAPTILGRLGIEMPGADGATAL